MSLKGYFFKDRYNEFRKEKETSIFAHKDEIYIVIYGAYNPPAKGKHLGEKERLIKLRNRLREDGFKNALIVEDIEDTPDMIIKGFSSSKPSNTQNLDNSFMCLEMADLNIFIFTHRGKTGSPARELKKVIPEMLYSCRVFEEVYKGISAMGILLKEELSSYRYNVTQIVREDDNDLYEHVSADVFLFLRQKYFY